MKINGYVEMLEVSRGEGCMYPSLISDGEELILVDACYPLQFDDLNAAIEKAGYRTSRITGIILTHQDLDHIGCVKEVQAQAPGLRVYAHRVEAPYVDGRQTPLKLAAAMKRVEGLPEEERAWIDTLKTGFANRRIPIDVELEDKQTLDIAGGIDIIHTPGHTPGHICLFVRAGGILITGDAMTVAHGHLAGPNPIHTPDMDEAMASLRKYLDYPVKTVISYHGGLFQGDVHGELKKLL